MNKLHIFLLLAASSVIIGCGQQLTGNNDDDGSSSKTNLAQGDVGVKTSDSEHGGTVTGHGKDGPTTIQTGSAAQLPKNFPSDVYLHPNADILNLAITPESTMIAFETEDSVQTVADAVKTNMLKNVWIETSGINMDGISMLAFAKDERTATVIITPTDTTTQISIALTEKAQ